LILYTCSQSRLRTKGSQKFSNLLENMSRRSSGSEEFKCISASLENSTNISQYSLNISDLSSSINNSTISNTNNIIVKECAAYCESSNPDSELIKVCINKHYMHIDCINELITKSTATCPMCRDDGMLKKFKTINNKYESVDSGMYITTKIIPKNIISTDSFVDITLVDSAQTDNKLQFPGFICALYSLIFPICIYVILKDIQY